MKRTLFVFFFFYHSTFAGTPTSQTLWDSWYTVTINDKIPYGYYHDQVEIKENRIHFQNQYWKLEDGTISEEQLGAFAINDNSLRPLFFNFHSTHKSIETKIDGTVSEKGQLTVKIQKGNAESKTLKKHVPQKTIFSIFFPLWLSKKLSSIVIGKTLTFSTLLEDNLEANYQAIPGTARLEKSNDFSKKTKTQVILVHYRSQQSLWFVEKSGMPIRILIPAQPGQPQSVTVEKVSSTIAQKFLTPIPQEN